MKKESIIIIGLGAIIGIGGTKAFDEYTTYKNRQEYIAESSTPVVNTEIAKTYRNVSSTAYTEDVYEFNEKLEKNMVNDLDKVYLVEANIALALGGKEMVDVYVDTKGLDEKESRELCKNIAYDKKYGINAIQQQKEDITGFESATEMRFYTKDGHDYKEIIIFNNKCK